MAQSPSGWSADDQALASSALYGLDPVLRGTAEMVLFEALGDERRRHALLLVVGEIGHATTQFEWLEMRAIGPSPSLPAGPPPNDPELLRLAKAYRAAFAAQAPMQDLLAIR
jgi:hypothetical protein